MLKADMWRKAAAVRLRVLERLEKKGWEVPGFRQVSERGPKRKHFIWAGANTQCSWKGRNSSSSFFSFALKIQNLGINSTFVQPQFGLNGVS